MFYEDLSWADTSDEAVTQPWEREMKEMDANGSKRPMKRWKSVFKGGIWRPSPTRNKNSSIARPVPQPEETGLEGKPSLRPESPYDISSKVEEWHEQIFCNPSPKKPARRAPRRLDFSPGDQAKQSNSATYQATLPSNLPSGAPLDPSASSFQEPYRTAALRRSNSTSSPSGRFSSDGSHHGSSRTSVETFMDEVCAVKRRLSRKRISRTTTPSEEIGTLPNFEPVATYYVNSAWQRAPLADGISTLPTFERVGSLRSITEPRTTATDEWMSSDTSRILLAEEASPDWNVLSAAAQDVKKHPSGFLEDDFKFPGSGSADSTQFQCFIRRMEGAGSGTILEHLNDAGSELVDEDARAEMELEKHLWVLTALQLQSINEATQPSQAAFSQLLRFPPLSRSRKILQLYGNLAEVYLLSAIHPTEKIIYLTPTRPASSTIPLPQNVTTLVSPLAATTRWLLPYRPNTLDHIRTTSLPALLPSSCISSLLKECHRILRPGGILELRLIDPAPKRASTGPLLRAWIEERLMPGVERSFCRARPSLLVPKFVREAGFSLLVPPGPGMWSNLTQVLKLPAAPKGGEEEVGNVDEELAAVVGRVLWKDVWGEFVQDDGGGWWWDDEDVVRECREFGTVWECGSLFAFK